MILQRRTFLTGFGALLAAPAIVRADTIMRVRSIPIIVPAGPQIKLQAWNYYLERWVDQQEIVPQPDNPFFDTFGQMSRAIVREHKEVGIGRNRFVANPAARQLMDIQLMRDRTVLLSESFDAPALSKFRGIPIETVEA